MKERIFAAVGANTFGLLTTIIIQLASLPIFVHYWGVEQYGVWLLLNAVPSYFTLLDFGMVQAASTNMMIEKGANNLLQVNKIFHTTTYFLILMLAVVLVVVFPIIYILDFSLLENKDYKFTLLVLILFTFISHFNGLSNAIFVATQRYAFLTYLNNSFRLFEWFCSVLALMFFGSFLSLAITLLAAKLFSLVTLFYFANKKNDGITWGVSGSNWLLFKQLIKPSLSFMSFSLNDAISLQGIVLVVGAVLGPASVTIFNAYRTFSRITVQITAILSHALWSEFGNLYGKKEFIKLKNIFDKSQKFGLLQAILLCGSLYFLSPYILKYWTHDKIPFDTLLMALTLLYAFFASCWHIPREFLKALNMHTKLVMPMIIASLFSVLFSYLLAKTSLALNGVTLVIVIFEALIMLLCLNAVKLVFKGKLLNAVE